MLQRLLPVFVTVLTAALCVGCDALLKRASALPRPFASRDFWFGMIGYMISAFVWVWLLQRLKLATLGAIYCLSLVILLAVVGTTLFGESLNRVEVFGLVLACVAIVILARFA
jgi:multidrug transporter EmrE-like cation transporter